jgi:tetratricopeptide (TPR) repeat protein
MKKNKHLRKSSKPIHHVTLISDDLNKMKLKAVPSKTVLLAILIACVCAAVITVHWPALSAQAMSFDDDQYLTDNTMVKSPSWFSAGKFLSQVLEPSTVKGYYQPLAMISLMLDYSLGGRVENLLPFHRTSLALHAANTALVIVLLYLLFGEVWIAAAVGLLFGLHPMTVETIPWVSERKTLLATFFALWSLIFYIRHTRSLNYYNPKSKIQNLKSKNLCFCFLFYLLALMSKPTSTPLPILMLLLDFWPLGRLKWPTVLEKIPFFILGGISSVITYISQTRTCGSTLPTEARIWHIPLILCHNIIFYLYKIIWPVNLSSHYPFPNPMNISQPMVLAGVIGTCILIPLLLISIRWTRAVFTGWLFFFVAILPTMQIIGFTNVIASDKFAYLPSVGLLMLLTFFLCKSKIQSLSPRKRGYKIIVTILVLSAAFAESLATRSYLVHWRNSIGLAEYMLSKAPNAPHLYNYLGAAYGNLGRYQEEIETCKQALRIKPDYVRAYNNLGIAYGNLGRHREAIETFSQAVNIKPDDAEAHYNLGVAYGNLGRYQEAIEAFRQAIRIKPDYAEAHNNLGVASSNLGRHREAIEAFSQTIKIKPDDVKAYNNLGIAYGNLDRHQEAIEAFRQALRIKPNDADAHYNLGVVYLTIGDKNSATEEYKILKTLDAEMAKKLFDLITNEVDVPAKSQETRQ